MAQPQANTSNCKIVSVVWFKVFPAKFGGQKAVALFNEHLSHFGDLTCICSTNNSTHDAPYTVDASLPVNKWQFLNPFVLRKIYSIAKQKACTHLILEFPYHGIAGVICKRMLGVKLITNTHNIEYLRFKEQNEWWWKALYRYEKWVLQNCDAVFFKTSHDRTVGIKDFNLPAQKTAIIPYGAATINLAKKAEAKAIIRKRYDIRQEEKILLFAGTLDYAPNAEAVVSIAEILIPLLNKSSLNYKVIICGRNHLKPFQHLWEIKNNNLRMAGEVTDIENYFMAADVFINPVLKGGGVQTKTMDALSYHLNVVAFKSRLYEIENTNNLFSVKDGDWTSFTKQIINASSQTMATDKAFFTTYNWDAIAKKAYEKLAAL